MTTTLQRRYYKHGKTVKACFKSTVSFVQKNISVQFDVSQHLRLRRNGHGTTFREFKIQVKSVGPALMPR